MTVTQPKRVSIPQPSSKAIKVVCDHSGRPILDGDHYLAWHSGTGRFYVGRTDPTLYVGKDLDAAIVEFKTFVGKLGDRRIPIPTGKDLEASVRQERQLEVTIDEDGKIEVADDIEASAFWLAVRRIFYDDPAKFRKEFENYVGTPIQTGRPAAPPLALPSAYSR